MIGGPINLNAEPNIYIHIYAYLLLYYYYKLLKFECRCRFYQKTQKNNKPLLSSSSSYTHPYLGHLLIIQFHHHRQRTKISFLAVYTMTILHLYLLLVSLFLMQQNVMSNTESEECNEKHNIADMPIFMIPSMAGTFFFPRILSLPENRIFSLITQFIIPLFAINTTTCEKKKTSIQRPVHT